MGSEMCIRDRMRDSEDQHVNDGTPAASPHGGHEAHGGGDTRPGMELHGGDKPASSHGTNDSAHASGSGHRGGGGGSHHAHMIADMRRRFWVCLALTVPVLLLSPMIQDWLGIEDALAFRGDSYLLFGLSTVCLLYTSDAADDLLCVDLGGRRIIKKKKKPIPTLDQMTPHS